MITASVSLPDWDAAVAAIEADARVTARQVLDWVGEETVAYLRSLTSELRPPAKTRGSRFVRGSRRFHSRASGRFVSRAESLAPRPAHPGHWADVTGELAESYRWEVTGDGAGATLTFANDADHAVYLEAHEGFFVLRGVMDPGGPVEAAIRRAVSRLAPEWEVRGGVGTVSGASVAA